VIESAATKELFANPLHPYTKGLLNCIPRLDEDEDRMLIPIKGLPPNLINMPPVCAFLPRCNEVKDICYQELPPLACVKGTYGEHFIRCFL
jgi:oligopeptide/dipeptide ABC transporter ATP-binding protein